MSELIDHVQILNRQTEKAEIAYLYDGISDNHIADFEKSWKPILLKKRKEIIDRLSAGGQLDVNAFLVELGKFGIQDSHWNWREINEKTQGELIYRAFALECQDSLQGLMLTHLGKSCRIGSQKNMPLVYIELVAVAPWNRLTLTENPKYKYVGKVLIATAISLSIEEEFGGRIGLHSLPQAVDYYEKKVGMKNLGPDSEHEDLNYYEMTPEQAMTFLDS